MRRWEFDSIAQADMSIATWFPGTINEQILLKDHLDATLGICYSPKQQLLSIFLHDFYLSSQYVFWCLKKLLGIY